MAGTDNEALATLLGRAQLTPEAFARRLNAFALELGRADRLDPKTP
jgi:hypothetical protein